MEKGKGNITSYTSPDKEKSNAYKFLIIEIVVISILVVGVLLVLNYFNIVKVSSTSFLSFLPTKESVELPINKSNNVINDSDNNILVSSTPTLIPFQSNSQITCPVSTDYCNKAEIVTEFNSIPGFIGLGYGGEISSGILAMISGELEDMTAENNMASIRIRDLENGLQAEYFFSGSNYKEIKDGEAIIQESRMGTLPIGNVLVRGTRYKLIVAIKDLGSGEYFSVKHSEGKEMILDK